MVINYDNLKQKTIYITPEISDFIDNAYKEQLKKSYVPYSIFVGNLIQTLKDKAYKN